MCNIKTISNIIKSVDLNKHEKLASILQYIVNYCSIDNSLYFILGSYALREHRMISDLDVNIDYDEFEKLQKLSFGKVELYNNQIRWFYDLTEKYKKIDPNVNDFSIEIIQKRPNEGLPNEKFSLKYLKENGGLDIDKYGHQIFNLKTLLAWKIEMNRDKDKIDIELINKIINLSDI